MIEEEVTIQEDFQEPQQQEPPKKRLYNALYSKKKYTKSYEDFDKQFSSPESIDKLYNALSKEGGYTKSKEEFNTQYFAAPIQKKKSGSIDFGASSMEAGNDLQGGESGSTTSEIPTVELFITEDDAIKSDDIVGLANRSSELSAKKKILQTGSSSAGIPTTAEVQDDEAKVEADKINKFIEGKGYNPKRIAEDFKDIPDYVFDVPEFTKPELLRKYKENPEQYQRNIASAKSQSAIRDAALSLPDGENIWRSIKEDYNNNDIGLFSQQRQRVKSIVDKAKLVTDDNESVTRNLAIDFSDKYGAVADKSGAIADAPSTLNSYQQAAWAYLNDFFPDEARRYKAALLNPKDIEGNFEAELQFEEAQKALFQQGLDLATNYAKENLNNLGKDFEYLAKKAEAGTITPQESETLVQLQEAALPFTQTLETAQSEKNRFKQLFPKSNVLDTRTFAQELIGQENTGLNWMALESGRATGNTVAGLVDIAKQPFLSDMENEINQAEILGGGKLAGYSTNLTQKNSIDKSFKPDLSPELQSEIDAIKKDKELSYEEKQNKVSTLLLNRPDEWQRTPDKQTNMGISSLMYGVAGLAANLAPFVVAEMATGGGATAGFARKFASTFTAAAATGFHEAYRESLDKGDPNPFARAMRVTAINSAAMAGAQTPAAIRKMLGNKTAYGKLVNGMTDDAIMATLKESPKSWKIFAKEVGAVKEGVRGVKRDLRGAVDVVKNATKEGVKFSTLMAGAQAANDAFDGDLQPLSEYAKHAAIETLKFGIFGSAMGAVGKITRPTNIQLANVLEAGRNKEPYLQMVDRMIQRGDIGAKEAAQVKKNIEDVSAIYEGSPILKTEGVSGEVQRQYLFNALTKKRALEEAKQLPSKQKLEAEHTAIVADFKNQILLDNTTLDQLNKRQAKLEKDLTPEKDADGKVIPIKEKEKQAIEAELEAVKESIKDKEEAGAFSNRVFDSNTQLGSSKEGDHISEEGYNYRTVSQGEIDAIRKDGAVLPREGKQKGGNKNTKYWTKGNGKNWYGDKDNAETIRVRQDRFSDNTPVSAKDVEVYNKETRKFEPLENAGETNLSKDIVLSNIEDIKLPTLREAVRSGDESAINEVLKMASDQWHDKGTREAAERDFGQPIIQEAIKKFPQKEIESLLINEPTTNTVRETIPTNEGTSKEQGDKGGVSEGATTTGQGESTTPPSISRVENKEFDKMASEIPNGGEVKKYLSGDTIKKYEEGAELRNKQEIIAQELEPALKHGIETISKAKEIFGDQYIEKTLEYIGREKLNPENKALLYVTLENEMASRVKAEPDNVGLKKMQDLVREQSQAFLRSSSLAINMGRLRKFAEVGYDVSKVTDGFFSSKELENKSRIEKDLQADAKTIQKQYEENIQKSESDIIELEAKVREGVDAEITKLYNALPKEKKTAADKAIAALDKIHNKLRSNTYESTLGVPIAIIDMGVVTIRAAIKAGVKVADAIELGINKIKEKYGKEWDKESQFRKDYMDGMKSEGALDKERDRQMAKEYRVLETERNRQLAKVMDLKEKIASIQNGQRPESKSIDIKLDVPEIESLKQQLKDETALLNKAEAQLNRIKNLEAELQRLKQRIPKQSDPVVKKQISDKEQELKNKIEVEKEAIRKEERYSKLFDGKGSEVASNAEKLFAAKEKIESDIEIVREEIIRKQKAKKGESGKLQDDLEMTRLREQKGALEKLRDTYLPKEKDSFAEEKGIERAKNKIVKENIELNRQIEKGEKDLKADKKTRESESLDKLKAERDARLSMLEAIDPTPKLYVEDALIKAGYGKTVNIKTKKGVEKRDVLDWTKLAGEEGSVDKVRSIVEKAIQESGFTPDQITRIKTAFEKEYNALREGVVEKGLNEIASRNKSVVSPEQKSAAKKLVEMYNYGLFDKDPIAFENTLAKTIGVEKLNEGRYKEVKDLGDAMAKLFSTSFQGRTLKEREMKSAIQVVEDKMRMVLNSEAKSHGSFALKAADITRTYMDAVQRMTLNNLKQATENPMSGFLENMYSRISSGDFGAPKEIREQRAKMAKSIYKDMVLGGGTNFGDVASTFVNKGNLEMYANKSKYSESKLFQGATSAALGRFTLDGIDSYFKAKQVQQKFTHNLIKILSKDRLIDGKIEKAMKPKEAKEYVAEKLTGQNFKDAQATAKEIIDKINSGKDKKILKDTPEFIDRLANDIVTAALVNGEKITADMVTAAYNSAYKAAGRGLGHVANNFISKQVGNVTGEIEKKINDAIKEKDYNKAAGLTIESIFFRNIANPYVGGGTNWVVLKLEKTGLGLLSGLGSMAKRGAKMDLTSEAGIKSLENAMYETLKIRDKLVRGAIGGATTALTALAWYGIINTDEYQKWRKKNKWASRYTDIITPEIILAGMANKNGEIKKYMEGAVNKNDAFDKGNKAIKGMSAMAQGDYVTAKGQLGEVVGSTIGVPIPWRLVRDGQQIWQGVRGDEVYRVDGAPAQSFMQGYLKAGLFDYLGLAPKHDRDDLQTLIDRNTVVSPKDLEEMVNNNDGGRELNEEEKDKYKAERAKLVTNVLKVVVEQGYPVKRGNTSAIVPYNEMTKDERRDMTTDIKKWATIKTKKELFGEKELDDEEKDADKELKELKKTYFGEDD